jgi:hypothetical protein
MMDLSALASLLLPLLLHPAAGDLSNTALTRRSVVARGERHLSYLPYDQLFRVAPILARHLQYEATTEENFQLYCDSLEASGEYFCSCDFETRGATCVSTEICITDSMCATIRIETVYDEEFDEAVLLGGCIDYTTATSSDCFSVTLDDENSFDDSEDADGENITDWVNGEGSVVAALVDQDGDEQDKAGDDTPDEGEDENEDDLADDEKTVACTVVFEGLTGEMASCVSCTPCSSNDDAVGLIISCGRTVMEEPVTFGCISNGETRLEDSAKSAQLQSLESSGFAPQVRFAGVVFTICLGLLAL